MEIENVILDLDETLIWAASENDYNIKQDEKNLFKKFEHKNMEDYYYIFYRPGLQDFLDYLFDNFNVSVWTAASKDYALFIIDKIILTKSNRKLDYIFFSYHCDLSKKLKNGIKDLSILWDVYKLPNYNENNTIIIDDNPDVHKTGFCIPIKEFIAMNDDSEKDEELIRIANKLQKLKNE
jgi:TFIIF-interacting CTD phosphatase-like protein